MAKHKHIPFVVLGAHDKPNKGMIAYKMPDSNMYNLTFVELENDGRYDFGDTIDARSWDRSPRLGRRAWSAMRNG